MLTVLESINLSTDYLAKKGVESPRTNAELLLAEILNCKRLDLYLAFDRPLQEDEVSKYREFIARRGKREPLQYITGKVEFFGYEFSVNKDVLIPRPETEILVETVIDENKNSASIRLLDIGTGSGNIPISLAKQLEQAEINSIDISSAALLTAQKNVDYHQVSERVRLLNHDIFDEGIKTKLGVFDIIVSNPPYVANNEADLLQEEIVNYEPRLAVTDFSDGFKFYRRISELGTKMLSAGGKIYFEVGKDQFEYVTKLLETNNYLNIRTVKDYLNIERVVIAEKL